MADTDKAQLDQLHALALLVVQARNAGDTGAEAVARQRLTQALLARGSSTTGDLAADVDQAIAQADSPLFAGLASFGQGLLWVAAGVGVLWLIGKSSGHSRRSEW